MDLVGQLPHKTFRLLRLGHAAELRRLLERIRLHHRRRHQQLENEKKDRLLEIHKVDVVQTANTQRSRMQRVP